MNDRLTGFPWNSLLEWYESSGRHDLEWRDYSMSDDIRAYRIWLSEICLQQTQVERVRGYFVRIIEKYPSVHSLAGASYEEFFPYYQGMGYYSRARNMLATAKIVSEVYGGVFPREKALLQKLPGVGGYTSSAILAFAYGEAYLAWDTNLEKVFARYYHGSRLDKLTEGEKEKIEEDFREFCIRHCDEGSNPGSRKKADWIASSLAMTEQDTIRAINNALMDFAATVDLKNPSSIDWENYPIHSGLWYDTRGSLEPQEMKKAESFPTPDATLVVILHQDHRIYYSSPDSVISSEGDSRSREILLGNTTEQDVSFVDMTEKIGYSPFILPPSLSRDTRRYVQDTFREKYSLELSVRPVHKKWLSEDGKPYIAVNAQIQTGTRRFREYSKSDAKHVLDAL